MLYLLENGADIDMFNNHHNTPFFLATESLQKEICQVKDKDQYLNLVDLAANRLVIQCLVVIVLAAFLCIVKRFFFFLKLFT